MEARTDAAFVYLKVPRFDASALYTAMNARRELRGMSWKQVAEEIGIADSTITRTATGGRVEGDGAMSMLSWLGLPPETFLRPPTGPKPDLRAQISNLFRGQQELSVEAAREFEAAIVAALEEHR